MSRIAVDAPARTFLDVPHVAPNDVGPGQIALLGAPHGSPYPSRAEVSYELATTSAGAPRAIREAAIESSSDIDHFDFDLGGPLLADGAWSLVDCGDLPLSPADGAANRATIEAANREILARGAVPFLLGGDDSVPIPWLAAWPSDPPIDILQLDAHIDWRDSIGGERYGYSSTMRRASEHAGVRSITQVGMRGVGSARAREVDDARAWGARLITVEESRRLGVSGIIDLIPAGGRLVIHVDCDVFDPSVCPSVNAPTPGGLRFEEVSALVRSAIAARGLAGFAIVELVGETDAKALSAVTAARLVCNAIGALARTS